jgi:hypothetical protein
VLGRSVVIGKLMIVGRRGAVAAGRLMSVAGKGKWWAKKIGGPMAPPTGSLAWLRAG